MTVGEDRMIVNETLKNIKRRRSIRSYLDVQIKDEELQAVLDAGMHAPNAGDQAWHFTVVQDRGLLDRLNLAAKEAARQMNMEPLKALWSDEKYDCLYGAPTLVIVSGDGEAPMPLDADCAAATQNMLIAAESAGLGSCWIFFVLMAFFTPQGSELRNELQLPNGYKPYASAVFGYGKGAPGGIPERKPGLVTYVR
jgi:nitroreductase